MKGEKRIPLVEQDRILLALRRLNMVVPNDYPILSLYLSIERQVEQHQIILQFLEKELEKISAKLTNQGFNPRIMLKDIDRIKEFIEFNPKEEIFGLAAFISGYRDLFLTYPVNYNFKNEIVLDKSVYKAPLVRLLAEQPPEVFIVLSFNQSTLYRFADGKLHEKEAPIRRNQNEELETYIRRVKDEFWPYFRSNDVKSIFLLGQKDLIDIFVSVLAKVAIQKIKSKTHVSSNVTKKELYRIAKNLIEKNRIIIPEQKVEHAIKMSQRGLAVFGAEAVLRALREGKVKELLIDPAFQPRGWRCKRCYLLGTSSHKACPWCGGEIKPIHHIRSALLKDVKLYDIQITTVHHPYLQKEGKGIAALLRFT